MMRRTRRLISTLAVIVLACTVPDYVVAQDVDPRRFTPLEPPNRWEYRVNQIEGSSAPGAYLIYEVEREDTLIDDKRYSILIARSFDEDFKPLERARYAFRLTLGNFPDVVVLVGDRKMNIAMDIPLPPRSYDEISEGGLIQVGDSIYTVEAQAAYGEFHSGSGGGGADWRKRFAADIGVYYFYHRLRGHWADPVVYTWEAVLTYARVDAEEYGATIVDTAVERPVDPRGRNHNFEILYPNPFQRTLQFEARGLMQGPGLVEVFDVSGRRVSAEQVLLEGKTSTIRVEEGPSGLYLLRVSDRSGRQARGVIVRVKADG